MFNDAQKDELWKVLRVLVYGCPALIIVIVIKKLGLGMSDEISMIVAVMINALLVGLKQAVIKK